MKTMPKQIPSVFGAFVMVFFVACKKDYVCQCVQTVTVPGYAYNNQTYPQQVTINTITNTFKSKKKDAETGCKQGESIRSYPSPYAAYGQGPTIEATTCELK